LALVHTEAPVHTQPPYLAHHFENLEQQETASTLGIWLFLATEILFFGAILGAYAIYRDKYTEAFVNASELLYLPLAAVNTVVLIGSSLTVVLAVHAVRLGKNGQLQLWLWMTILLGLTFLILKVFEYNIDFRDGLNPVAFHPKHDEWKAGESELKYGALFYCFYYITTLLHATHMVIGLVIFGILIYQTRQGMYSPAYRSPIETTGLYWHFVDIVWVFLFPLLYLVR
jgi:cytochrome c oxidase subunit III